MTNERATLQLLGHFPGRLRLRSEAFRGGGEIAEAVVERLGEEPGVTSTSVRPVTGSLVIEYRPSEIEATRVVQIVVRAAGLSRVEVEVPEPPNPVSQGSRVRDALGRLNAGLGGVTNGNVDARVAVPGTLAALGVAKLLFGRKRLPEWYDLMFWAFVTFSNLNPPKKDATTDGEGASA